MLQSELDKYQKILEVHGDSYAGYNHAKHHYNFIIPFLDVEKSLVVADLGCGCGYFPNWIKCTFPQHTVYGIEPVFAPFGDKSYGVDYLKGDSTNIPLEKVDILFSFDVMEHIHPDDLEQSLQEIYRVTKCFVAKISTVPSAVGGVHGEDLHPIVQPLDWWVVQLKRFFENVSIQGEMIVCQE